MWRITTINPSTIEDCGYCCTIEYLVSFWVNIGQATLIPIYHYSDSVSWWSQNSRKMALALKIWRTATIFPSPLIDHVYCCTLEPLIFSVWLLIKLHYFIFHIPHIWCLGDHKIVEKLPYLHKYEESPQYFLPSCIIWTFLSHKSFDFFSSWIFDKLHYLIFLITWIWCICDHKIV